MNDAAAPDAAAPDATAPAATAPDAAAPDATTPAAGPAPDREERYRLAVVVVSATLLLLLAPLILPFADKRSFVDSARRETTVLLVMAAIFFWPLFLGVIGLARGLRRRPAPGTLLFAIPAVLHLLAALGAVATLLSLLADRSRARETPAVWLALLLAIATVYVLARGFRRAGWERWAQLVTGVWMGYAASTALFVIEVRDMLDAPEIGAFVVLLALSFAAPAVGWILWPRKR